MVDLLCLRITMVTVDREGRALQRCNLSARSMPGDGQEHRRDPVLLPSPPSSGPKAINLLNWGEAPTQGRRRKYNPPVGHMSTFVVRLPPPISEAREIPGIADIWKQIRSLNRPHNPHDFG
jgi:hypothetical protein